MTIEIFDQIEQKSPEWYAARCGLITASEFKTVLAKGEGISRKKYMYTLAGERFTGRPTESYTNAYMQRGNDLESRARELYQEQTGNEVRQVGFIKNDHMGYSPDGLIGDKGAVEIKVAIPSVQIERLIAGKVPSEHVAQCQGGNLVAGLDYVDFVSYCEGLPLLIVRAGKNEDYLGKLKSEIDLFEDQLLEIVKQIGEF